jgi:hypothetical protein
MITTYQALTMGQYQEIDRITRTGGDELEVQVAILSILTGKTEAELLRLPLPEYTAMAGASAFLRSPIAEVPKVRKEYALGEWRLRPCQDYRKLTAGQYIDFQAFTKDTLDFCGLLSVLMVPEGRTYAEGYDPLEVRAAIADRLPMPDGMALIAFFLKQYAGLIRASLTYSENALRRVKDKTKRAQIQARINQARILLNLAGGGLRM